MKAGGRSARYFPRLFCRHAVALAILLPSPAPTLGADELFLRVSPAVVLIAVSDGQGRNYGTASGVVIAPGEIVTNCHAIAGAAQVAVAQGAGNKAAPASLRYADPERDLCQLSVQNKGLFPLAVTQIAPLDTIRVGMRVYAVGAPRGMELTISEGIVSSLRVQAGTKLIQTTAAISPGSSGGGLFDAQARLIGITSFLFKDAQNLNFAYPAAYIAELSVRSQRAGIENMISRRRSSNETDDPRELEKRQRRDQELRKEFDLRRQEELRRQGFAEPASKPKR